MGLFIFSVLASSYNHVRNIEIKGNALVTTEQIAEYSVIDPNMSMLHLTNIKSDIESSIINSHPTIKNATLSIQNRHDVLIEVQEYRPVAYVKDADFYYLVLENATIVDEAFAQTELSLPILTDFDENKRKELVQELTKIPNETLNLISEVVSIDATNNRIALSMTDGNIVVGLVSTIANRMQYYSSIVEQLEGITGLIDMEVGIYYQELTPTNNPFASDDEKQEYTKSLKNDESAANSASEISVSEAVTLSEGESVSEENSSTEETSHINESSEQSSIVESSSVAE